MYFNVFFKLIKVHLLVSELYICNFFYVVQELKTNTQNSVEHITALWLLHQNLKNLHLGILCNTCNEYQSSENIR